MSLAAALSITTNSLANVTGQLALVSHNVANATRQAMCPKPRRSGARPWTEWASALLPDPLPAT